MKILNYSECERVAGGLIVNQYENHATIMLGLSESFTFSNGEISFSLDYNGLTNFCIMDTKLITSITGCDPFSKNGITLGPIKILGAHGDVTSYTLYNYNY
ncbi:MAG: hypothetical protein BGO43_04095 [Gammaproteobacteria bacterium 39-13]|nr:hypothetical protein [Gammaproteobacteria bacterium]OJV94871.1 MAG: hypothetical protein BGO43_04095 [Gammaproteobacteria bacterium 39-13]